MRKEYFLILMLFILRVANLDAQVKIGSGEEPHAGAILDLKTANNKGFLLPNVTLNNADLTQFILDEDAGKGFTKTNAMGMIVYNSADDEPYTWDGTTWRPLVCDPITNAQYIAPTSDLNLLRGASYTFTASVNADGNSPVYTWYVNGNPQTGITSNSFNYNFSTVGEFKVRAEVTNCCTATAVSSVERKITISEPCTVPVSTVSLTPTNPSITRGALQKFTATVNFGMTAATAPITYTWSVDGNVVKTGTENTLDYTFNTVSSSIPVVVTATNSCTGTPAQASTAVTVTLPCTVAVSTVSLTPTNPSITRGTLQKFTATVNFGMTAASTPITYTWSVDGNVVKTGTENTLDYTFNTVSSSIPVVVTATNSCTGTPAQASTAVTVTLPCTVAVSAVSLDPLAPSVTVNTSKRFTATVNFGMTAATAPITYTWYVNGSVVKTGTENTLDYTFNTVSGSIPVVVTATNSCTGTPAQASTAVAVIPLCTAVSTVSLDPLAPSVTVNTSKRFTATVNFGMAAASTPITYTWYVNGGVVKTSTTENTLDHTFNTVSGSIPVVVTATNSCTGTPAQASTTVNVIVAPFACGGNGVTKPLVGANATYETYLYGSDCWMVSNSKEGNYMWDVATYGAYYMWDDYREQYINGGGKSVKTACPEGWALPTTAQVSNLISVANADANAAKYWNTSSNRVGGYYSGHQQNGTGYWWAWDSGTLRSFFKSSSSTSGLSGLSAATIENSSWAYPVRCVKE